MTGRFFDAIRFHLLVSADPNMKVGKVISVMEKLQVANALPSEARRKIARFIKDLEDNQTRPEGSVLDFDVKAWDAYVIAIPSTASYYLSKDEFPGIILHECCLNPPPS